MDIATEGATRGRARFNDDAANVLGGLRSSLATVIASVGGIQKASDLQRAFNLDWTLSWQLFQVAGASGAGGTALNAGANVPSKNSLKKFLTSAKVLGVAKGKLDRVRSDYEAFERLVDEHAGDRGTFNTMVSAAAGMDDEWLAADAQHRRFVYRGMSHMVGMQAKAKHVCSMLQPNEGDPRSWEFGVVLGYVGLRILREIPNALVFRARVLNASSRSHVSRKALGDGEGGNQYLLSEFSTKPLPRIRERELDAGWVVSELDQPSVGNHGVSTLRFATAYFNHPFPVTSAAPDGDNIWTEDMVVDKPVEVLFRDTLVKPGMMRGVKPVGELFLGNNHGDGPALPGDLVKLMGDHKVEMIGRGPDALATPLVPDYPEMMRATAKRLGWNVEDYEVWRLRIEYPAYQATARVAWQIPRG